MKKELKEVKEEKAIIIAPKKELVLEGDPMAQLQFAQKAAQALMSVVSTKKNPVIINGKQFLEFGDMQTLGRFFGATVGVEWTRKLDKGWEARAIVYQHGQIVSSAEAQCTRDERKWASRDDFQIRSMAQTRASSKALKNGFGWVAELAGYSSTPLEEMDNVQPDREVMKPYKVQRTPIEYPPMTEQNDIQPLKEKTTKEHIKDLLSKLGKNPKTLREAKFDVRLLTGLFYEEGANDKAVIDALENLVRNKKFDADMDDVVGPGKGENGDYSGMN